MSWLMISSRCCSDQNWEPSNVSPKYQLDGATFVDATCLPSLVVTRKDKLCPTKLAPACQFCPQLRFIWIHGPVPPLIDSAVTSPAPPTLVTNTRSNQGFPLIVKRIPPVLTHGTLYKVTSHNLSFRWSPHQTRTKCMRSESTPS